ARHRRQPMSGGARLYVAARAATGPKSGEEDGPRRGTARRFLPAAPVGSGTATEAEMAKRSVRAAAVALDDHRGQGLRAGEAGWDPADGQRDRRYVRRVRPQGENQRRLMEAIGRSALTLALGPAGT